MALYQKYRPMNFDEVVGQEHVTKTLQNLIKMSDVPHAYLFFGPQGTGKTSVARILARAVNCTGGTKPCNQCDSCKTFIKGSLDLIEMDAATHSGVDMVRETIRDAAYFQPNMATYKIYIIDEAHGLSRQAFDALLKILEEPPKHLIFILATTEFEKVPKTIISRCQLHGFHRISTKGIFELLCNIATKEGIVYEDTGLRTIARLSNGCARDAVSLLDQVSVYDVTEDRIHTILGLGREGDAIQFVESLERGIGDVLEVLDVVFSRGISPSRFIDQVAGILQLLLRYRMGSLQGESEGVCNLCKKSGLSANAVVEVLQALISAKKDLRSMDPFTVLSMYLVPVVSSVGTFATEVVGEVSVMKSPSDPHQDPIVKELLAAGFEIVFSNPK